MFGNCPWNLNSSILVNSAAERQAQKRKIRNGQLPMPKLIKTSRLSYTSCITKPSTSTYPSIPDSLLPDTVVLSEDIEKNGNALEFSGECRRIPSVEENISQPISEDDTCSSAMFSAHNLTNSSFLENKRLELTHGNDGRIDISNHKAHLVSATSSAIKDNIFQRGYVDLNDTSFFRKIRLEASDGHVLKLACNKSSPKVITIVQESKITFWESLSLMSDGQSSWCQKASIPISVGVIRGLRHMNKNELLLELGLCPSRWTSVVLTIDSETSLSSVYGYDAQCATKVIENSPWSPLTFKNHKRLFSCLLDSSALLIWCHNDGIGIKLKKFVLSNNLDELVEENELVGTDSNIQSFHSLGASKPIVVGISDDYQVIMWNYITGNTIKSFDLFSSGMHSCVEIIEDKGFLFLLANGKSGSAHIIAINVSTERWMILKTFTSNRKEWISGCTVDDGLMLAAYEDRIAVWDMETAMELSSILPQRKCVPQIFSRDTVFLTDDCQLYILENSLILPMKWNSQCY